MSYKSYNLKTDLRKTSSPALGKHGFIERLTHMVCEADGGAREIIEVRLADISILYDQVDGHFALQAADVAMAEVITQLMNLQNTRCLLESLSLNVSRRSESLTQIVHLL